ncbi:uncharacterized protein LOC131021160 [Salvia miltiorrhiza]|uniref:uncharacterized protein LOC131021160 n=1 Tax=Salvia miltiorrhiza TaxID=226208 RepID=UPI0025AC0353|nr:uncharacterized protein LOC131021160 [Salvia miltiorrhiza]
MVGLKPLKFVFPRLYHLCANKDALISESGAWENGRWKWQVTWRRELLEREVEGVNELFKVIALVNPVVGSRDRWSWSASSDSIYSTRSAYEAIKEAEHEMQREIDSKKILPKAWKIPAPHKAKVTAWRILQDRLPSCDNLRKRNILLSIEELHCNACFFQVESTNHLLLHCPKSVQVWDEIHKWLGVSFVRLQDVVSHFVAFTGLGNYCPDDRSPQRLRVPKIRPENPSL